MEHRARPLPACLLAIAALAAAPACLARQSAPAEPDPHPPASESAAPAHAPRSAFGKVMSVLISALQENADRSGDTSLDPALALKPAASATAAPAARDIQVSSAFQLDPPHAPTPPGSATASID